jgi:16S rRNA (guanine966-N2)-methyltransferase
VLHITGGDWRGRKLRAPEGLDTRPTPSRVREALFSILGLAVRGAHFHDLFAGCGIVGLEALSRGAASCTFCEDARPALTELRANIETLGCADRAFVIAQRIPAGLPPAPSVPSLGSGEAALALVQPTASGLQLLASGLQPPVSLLPSLAASLQPDIYFLDPPYKQNLTPPTLDRLVELGWSALPGGICVTQVEKLADLAERFGNWGLRRRYPYGDTALWVYDWEE